MRDSLLNRNEKILEDRLAGRKLADIGREHSLTAERVRQICLETAVGRTKDEICDLKDRGMSQAECLDALRYKCMASGIDAIVLENIIGAIYRK